MFGTQSVAVQNTHIIGLTDTVSGKESPFKVAVAYSKKRHAVKFLSGKFAANGKQQSAAWLPLNGLNVVDSVRQMYKANDVDLACMTWSRGMPMADTTDNTPCDEHAVVIEAIALQADQ